MEEKQELIKALVAVQKELKNIQTDSVNPHFKNKYASLSACLDAVREPLAKHGLVVIQTTQVREDESATTVCITTIWHSSGQSIEGEYPVVPQQQTPQGYGSGLTYARRYALLSILGLATEDDDGAIASQRAPGLPAAPKPQNTSTLGGVTAPQLKRLFAISKKNGWQDTDVKAYLQEIGLASSKELNYVQYHKLIENIEKFPKNQESYS